jgi:hypothetical protein
MWLTHGGYMWDVCRASCQKMSSILTCMTLNNTIVCHTHVISVVTITDLRGVEWLALSIPHYHSLAILCKFNLEPPFLHTLFFQYQRSGTSNQNLTCLKAWLTDSWWWNAKCVSSYISEAFYWSIVAVKCAMHIVHFVRGMSSDKSTHALHQIASLSVTGTPWIW